jgi:hypothetical protein
MRKTEVFAKRGAMRQSRGIYDPGQKKLGLSQKKNAKMIVF